MSRPLIVFVCTGNVCRSPMAEGLLRHRLEGEEKWEVGSAGLAAAEDMPPSPEAVQVMAERDVDISGYRSRRVTANLVARAHVLVVMTTMHWERLREQFPGVEQKMFLLKSFSATADDRDLEDPIGLGVSDYRRVRDEIEQALSGLIEFLQSLEM